MAARNAGIDIYSANRENTVSLKMKTVKMLLIINVKNARKVTC